MAGRCLRLLPILVCLALVILTTCGKDSPTKPKPPEPPPTPPVSPVATRIEITPSSATLNSIGQTVRLTARVFDQNNSAMVGATVIWSSSDVSVAGVNTQGLVTAVKNGTTDITARSGNARVTANISVSQAAGSIAIAPQMATLMSIGATVQLTATVLDGNGQPVADAVVRWSSGDELVATVNADGLVTAVGNGVVRITATSGSASAGIDVTVMQSAGSIVIAPMEANLMSLDATVQLTATVLDGNGQPVADAVVRWSSGDELVATVNADGLVTAVGNGVVRITATSGNTSAFIEVMVMQTAGSIVIAPEEATLMSLGATLQLSATVLDQNGQPVVGAVVIWQSSDESVAAVSAGGLVSAVKNGTARITATSGIATAGIDVTVMQSAGSILIAPDIATLMSLGATVQLTVTVLDQNGQPVADATVTWQSSDESVATVSAQGLVTAVANGVVRVTATSGSASSSVEITVRVPSPDRKPLLALYNATEGSNWTNNTNWLSDRHIEDWYGVNTDEDGRVTSLNLGNNGLHGPLPIELAQLSSLVGLSLEGNRLTGTIPPELVELTSLKLLYLFDNQLTGAIPPNLGLLVNLIHLCLNGNQLTGSIPPELGGLTNLKWLHLHFNTNLTGALPVELVELDLDALLLQGTQLCLPGDPRLEQWVSEIADARVGQCEGFDTERIALEALYNATNGPNWNNNTNWLSEVPLGSWRGVVTDINGRVTSLRLDGNGLSGTIPPDLAQLINLSRLDLGHNHLTGGIPAELGLLGNLAVLSFENNQLSGDIPAQLGNLTNLEVMRLSQNLFSGNIPAEIGLLANLRELYLFSSHVSGGIPAELGQLEKLTLLWLGGNRMEGGIPEELGQLSNLGELRLIGNRLTGSIPAELGQLKNLKVLELSGNELSGEIPAELGRMTNLTQLDLQSNQLSGSIPAELGQLTNLQDLFLSRNHLTGIIPGELGQLASLGRLMLGRNRLSGIIPPELGQLATLYALGLQVNQLTGPVPAELGQLGNLGYLFLEKNTSLTGPLPRELLVLSLQELSLDGTQLCVPLNSEYQDWIIKVPRKSGVMHCDSNLASEDKNVLIALYETTDGPNWTNSENWLSNRSIDQWFGVTTNDAGRVEQLSLEHINLSGTLPGELGRLLNLKVLRLSGNPLLSGSLPRELTGLFLETLQLDGTQMCAPPVAAFQTWLERVAQKSGVVICEDVMVMRDRRALTELYHTTNGVNWTINTNWLSDAPLDDWYGVTADPGGRVTRLSLHSNNLAGSLPPELGELMHLVSLSLDENKLSGRIPAELGNLTSLTSLKLGYNQLSGGIPAELGQLSKLRTFDLTDNQFTGSIPHELGQLTNLNWLRLGDNRLTDGIPAELGQIPNLEVLDLHKNQLAGGIPPELGRLANLITLSLDNNNLSGNIPVELSLLANLWNLHLSNNHLSGGIPAEFGRLADLRSLILTSNQLEGNVPGQLGDLAHLEELELSQNVGLFGPIPFALTKLALDKLYLDGTQLCVPNNSEFENWVQGIRSFNGVTTCRRFMSTEVYLTQTVQSFTRPVPLVAGEPALMRVFFRTEEDVLNKPSVKASFYLHDVLVHSVEIPPGPVKVPFEIEEGSIDLSANAIVPREVISPGLELVLEIGNDGMPDPESGTATRFPETGKMSVNVRSVPIFNLTLVPMLWVEDPDYGIVTEIAGLTKDDDLFRLTRDLLPVNEFELVIRKPFLTSFQPMSSTLSQMVGEIEALRAMESGNGYYMGIPAGLGGTGIGVSGGYSSISTLVDFSMAHELGHNMSLWHAPCGGPGGVDRLFPNSDGSIGVWGYDLVSGALVQPSSPDIMSYCFDSVWISDYHFNKAIDYITSEAEIRTISTSPTTTRSLLVWGGVNERNELFINPSFAVDAAPALPRNVRSYRIAGEDADGNALFNLDFAMNEIADGEGGVFAFAIPVRSDWSDSLARITLSGPEGFVEMTRESGRSAALLLDQSTGQVRGILRDWPDATSSVQAARRVLPEPGLEVVVSPGIPDSSDW